MPDTQDARATSTQVICHHCRYDLRGLPDTARCPECGSCERDTTESDQFCNEAALSFLFGILGLIFLVLYPLTVLTPFCGPLAILCGEIAHRKAENRPREGRRLALAGRLLGWVTFLPLVCLVIVVLIVE